MYAIFSLRSGKSGGETVGLGNISFYTGTQPAAYLTKITTDGDVEWVTKPNDGVGCQCSLSFDSLDNVIIGFKAGNGKSREIFKN